MKIEMTPLKVEILLWYYSTDSNFPRLDVPACKVAMDELVERGIAKHSHTPNNGLFVFNREALSVYIEEILSVPLPTKTWTIVR